MLDVEVASLPTWRVTAASSSMELPGAGVCPTTLPPWVESVTAVPDCCAVPFQPSCFRAASACATVSPERSGIVMVDAPVET